MPLLKSRNNPLLGRIAMRDIRCGLLLHCIRFIPHAWLLHALILLCVYVIRTSYVYSVVCRLDPSVSPAKTAEPIEVPFGLGTWVGPRNHVLDGSQRPTGMFVCLSSVCLSIPFHFRTTLPVTVASVESTLRYFCDQSPTFERFCLCLYLHQGRPKTFCGLHELWNIDHHVLRKTECLYYRCKDGENWGQWVNPKKNGGDASPSCRRIDALCLGSYGESPIDPIGLICIGFELWTNL